MKKIVSVISALVLMLMTLSVSAQENKHFLVSPTEQNFNNFVFDGNAMRITSETIGFRYIVEFDVNFPSTSSETKYELFFNHNATDTDKKGVSHGSKFIVNGNEWKWVLDNNAGNVALGLSCGEQYHISVGVDLKEQLQFCIVSASDGTVVGSVYDKPFKEPIANSSPVGSRTTHHIRWSDAWVDTGAKTWKNVRPSNVNIKRNSTYVVDIPEITYDNEIVGACVTSYHNILQSVESPILMLCIYNSENMLVDIATSQETHSEKASALPASLNLSVSKNIKLTSGMKVRAMVVNSLGGRLPYVEAAEWIYSE